MWGFFAGVLPTDVWLCARLCLNNRWIVAKLQLSGVITFYVTMQWATGGEELCCGHVVNALYKWNRTCVCWGEGTGVTDRRPTASVRHRFTAKVYLEKGTPVQDNFRPPPRLKTPGNSPVLPHPMSTGLISPKHSPLPFTLPQTVWQQRSGSLQQRLYIYFYRILSFCH